MSDNTNPETGPSVLSSFFHSLPLKQHYDYDSYDFFMIRIVTLFLAVTLFLSIM